MAGKEARARLAAEAELLRQRLMPFLLGGLRAPLPDFENRAAARTGDRRKTRRAAGKAA